MTLLTIAIPTFNRNELLARNLPVLSGQLSQEVRLLVIDNASSTPVSETLIGADARIEVRRNPVNIGGNGNILRCFESCGSEWIWVLGDDDRVEPDAVATILGTIAGNPSALFINYSTRLGFCRAADKVGTGVGEFLRAVEYFGNVLFVSSCVFRASALLRYMDFGHQYAYSCGPHIAMLLMALGQDGAYVLSAKMIVGWDRPEIENRGSVVTIALGLPTLLELPLEPDHRRLLAKQLANFPPVSEIAHQTLLGMLFGDEHRSSARRVFRQIIARIPMRWGVLRHVQGWFWRPLLLFPGLTYRLASPFYRLITKHPTGAHKLRLKRL